MFQAIWSCAQLLTRPAPPKSTVCTRHFGVAASSQVPHYYLTVEARVDKLLALRTQINESLAASGEGKLSVNDFVIKASALVRNVLCTPFHPFQPGCISGLAQRGPEAHQNNTL